MNNEQLEYIMACCLLAALFIGASIMITSAPRASVQAGDGGVAIGKIEQRDNVQLTINVTNNQPAKIVQHASTAEQAVLMLFLAALLSFFLVVATVIVLVRHA